MEKTHVLRHRQKKRLQRRKRHMFKDTKTHVQRHKDTSSKKKHVYKDT